jgi:MFS family permease
MYDFMVFGYYAAAIGHAFFPSGNSYVSLMLSLATFGAGFLMRPLGAVVLGAYADRHGRRALRMEHAPKGAVRRPESAGTVRRAPAAVSAKLPKAFPDFVASTILDGLRASASRFKV